MNSKPTPIARSVSGGSSSDRQETNYEPPRHKHVVFKKSGTGISTTERFDVSDDWDLEWAYNCSNFSDGSGNFQVYIYKDGSMSDEAGVNELGSKNDGTEHLHGGAGTRYLTMNSECNWVVEALSE